MFSALSTVDRDDDDKRCSTYRCGLNSALSSSVPDPKAVESEISPESVFRDTLRERDGSREADVSAPGGLRL